MQIKSPHMCETTRDISTLETWMRELGHHAQRPLNSHRLVYRVAGGQQLEVHSAYLMELDGRPMQIPACVVVSGKTDFEFFDDKGGLFRLMGVKEGVAPEGGTDGAQSSTDVCSKENIEMWMSELINDRGDLKRSEASSGYSPKNSYYTGYIGSRQWQIQIVPAREGSRAYASLLGIGTNYNRFTNKGELFSVIETMLNLLPYITF